MNEIVEILKANIQPPIDLRSVITERDCADRKRERKTSEILVDAAQESGEELHYALDKWLDFLLDAFSAERYAEGTFESNFEKVKEERPEYYDLTHRWINTVYKNKELGHCTDFFGAIYEENFQSSHKATQLGQFYTPMSLSRMMGEIVFGEKTDKCVLNDCACGSGRLLLGYSEKEGFQRTTFYTAGDIDPQSVKMCALNFMMMGLQGVVLRQDALRLNEPSDIFLVNQVDYPIETGLRSITRITTEEALRIGLLNKRGEQFYLSSAYIDRHRNMMAIVNGIDPKKAEKVHGKKPTEPIRERKEQKAIQLTLFD